MLQSTKILGVKLNTVSRDKILEYIVEDRLKSVEKTVIFTPNPELIMLAYRSPQYKEVLNSAHLSLPDGVGTVWASKILGLGIQGRITGVDFMKSICEKVSKRPVNIGLFGARPGVAERVADCLREMYPSLQISYTSATWDFSTTRDAKIDILFVALGSPKQEQWIYDNLSELPVKVVMGVGGSFDMISGKVRRAPAFMQKSGLEWLWRLINQPWRAKRQTSLLLFAWLIITQRIRNHTH